MKEFEGIVIPKKIWFNHELNHTDKIVYGCMFCTSFESNRSYKELAIICNLSRGRVIKSVKTLVDKGLILKEKNGASAINTYKAI